MNVSHTTIKDKEIPRWHPLQRVALSKLSLKRLVLLVLALTLLPFLFSSSFITRNILPAPHETDAQFAASNRNQLLSKVHLRQDFSTATKPTAIFVTARNLLSVTELTGLACDVAATKRMNVLMIFTGADAAMVQIPLLLRLGGFDGYPCPMVWHDARYQYSSEDGMIEATIELLDYAANLVNPSVVVHIDDEESWFLESVMKSMLSRRQSTSLIQLKRQALHNLRWIGSLTPHALAGYSKSQN